MSGFTTHLSLLQRISDCSDQTAWQEFHDRYGLLIRRTARRQGLQDADCDEVVQNVLTALTKAMAGFRYDPSRGMFRAYLKTVTLRAIFSHRNGPRDRAVGQDQLVERAVDDSEFEAMWESEWRQYHLRLAMQTVRREFNRDDLAAFEAYAVRGEAAQVTASSLGMTRDQVYQAKSRILKRLESVIELQVQEEG